MALDNILVAYDGSEGSRHALEVAASIAEGNENMNLDLVYVVPIPLLTTDQMQSFQSILDMMVSDGESLLAAATDELADDVVERTDTLLITGTNPASEILRLAEQRNYDLIVVGNRGLSGIKEYTGSVSHKVLAGSKIPVLIAK